MKELRSHFSKSGILTNIGIIDVLRKWHPNHTITQTPKSTGILKLAKVGYADATLDTEIEFYAARTYKPAIDGAKGTERLKDKVEFGRYKYRWKVQDFQVYVADFWETEYSQVENHYILYPRSQGDMINGRSQTVDNLITAATQHLKKMHMCLDLARVLSSINDSNCEVVMGGLAKLYIDAFSFRRHNWSRMQVLEDGASIGA